MQAYDFDLRGGFSHVEEAVQSEVQTAIHAQKPAQASWEPDASVYLAAIPHYSLHLRLSLPRHVLAFHSV